MKDRPDLQVNNFGIEVTRAIDKKDAEQCKLDSKVLSCETYKGANEYINNLKHPEKYRSKPIQIPSSDKFSLKRGGGYDDKKPITLIVNAVNDKSKKFCTYPNHMGFLRRGLYVFDDELRPCLQYFDVNLIVKATNDSVFDVVFVHQLHKLIVVERGKISIQELDKIDIINIKCEVKRISGSPDYSVYCERAKLYAEEKVRTAEVRRR